MNLPVQIAGMVWYSEAEYPKVLATMKDAHLLPRTFADWLRKAEQGEALQQAQGVLTFRVLIELDAFVAYCNRLGLEVDAKARTRFANEAAIDAYRKGGTA